MPEPPTRRCMVGFAQVPAELLDAPVSRLTRELWMVLDLHQGNRADTWPSREHLAEHLSCSARQVTRAAAQLEDLGWLAVERGDGRGRTSRYRVLGRPGKGDTRVTVSGGKGDTSIQERVTPVSPRSISSEPESDSRSSAQGSDRARDSCAHGRPIAVDGARCADCAELERGRHQRTIWPAAVEDADADEDADEVDQPRYPKPMVV